VHRDLAPPLCEVILRSENAAKIVSFTEPSTAPSPLPYRQSLVRVTVTCGASFATTVTVSGFGCEAGTV
jgi:hypothetical protein